MTDKECFNAVANGEMDVPQVSLKALSQLRTDYCVIGGLAVNAHAEPVVSLDLDVVVAATGLEAFCAAMRKHFAITPFANNVKPSSSESDLRIQLQTDLRYQESIRNATVRSVLGHEMLGGRCASRPLKHYRQSNAEVRLGLADD